MQCPAESRMQGICSIPLSHTRSPVHHWRTSEENQRAVRGGFRGRTCGLVLFCSALLLLPQVYALLPLLRCACCQLHPWVAEAMVLVLEALLPCFCTLFFLTLLPGVEPAVPLEDFYPFGRDKGDSQTIAQDDGGSGLLEISVAFPFFGDRHTGLYVSTEECVSADVFWNHWLWVCMHLVAGNWIWNVVNRIRALGSWDVAHSQILHCGTLREFVYVHVEYRVFPSRV